jgi:2-polyprenyl-3-methyl-5-hydroxy-6-metoxy-1,4-benzoquinol methylase
MTADPLEREDYVALSSQYANSDSLMYKKLRLVDSHITGGKTLLDFGAGTGELIALEARKFDVICGVDVNEESVAICRDRFKNNKKIHILQNSGNDTVHLFADARFDCVVACDVLEHVELHATKKLLAAFYSLLYSGGIFVFSGPGISQKVKIRLGRAPGHIHSHSSYGWATLIRNAGFQLISVESVEFPLIHSSILRKSLHIFGQCCVITARKAR